MDDVDEIDFDSEIDDEDDGIRKERETCSFC